MDSTAVSLGLVAFTVLGALLGGMAARRLGQPTVVGVIGFGVGLGTLLHQYPAIEAMLLPQSGAETLHVLGQLGLLLFMFVVGHEMRAGAGHATGPRFGRILSVNLLLPLLVGVSVSAAIAGFVSAPDAPRWAAVIFMGLALSITAVPVLATILDENGARDTRVGSMAVEIAVGLDALAWLGVAVLIAVTGGKGPLWPGALAGVALLLAGAVVVPKTVRLLSRKDGTQDLGRLLAVLVVAAVTGGLGTWVLGLHGALGALIIGLVWPSTPESELACSRIRILTLAVFLPIFFVDVATRAPLQAAFGTVGASGAVMLLLAAAIAGKVMGALLSGAMAGLGRRDALALAALLNCRGVTEVVFASIGSDAGLISPASAAALCAIAFVTTGLTLPAWRAATRPRVGGRPAAVTRQEPGRAGQEAGGVGELG